LSGHDIRQATSDMALAALTVAKAAPLRHHLKFRD